MYIKDLFLTNRPTISFEIFPPKKDWPIETIYKTIGQLEHLNPDFISVTYGAGGSSKERTVEISSIVKKIYNIEPIAHLTCVSSSKDEINGIIDNLIKNNINNIMALRGDIPHDTNNKLYPELRFAKDLIGYIKENYTFCIGAACYPEGHPECKDVKKCTEYLKEKVHAGADFLTTQLFLDNDYFYNFYDITKSLGINVPICVGIMPITNKSQIDKIISLCGINIPLKINRILNRYENDPYALEEAGISYATEQIIDLLSWGVDGIHIYTMNKPEIAKSIINNLLHIREALHNKKST